MKTMTLTRRRALALLPAVFGASCVRRTGGPLLPPNQFTRTISVKQLARGGGATFPDLVYQDLIAEYLKGNSRARISYDAVGSEEGVRNFLRGKVDFAGCDWRLTADEEDALVPGAAQRRPHLYIPTVAGAVAPIYRFEE